MANPKPKPTKSAAVIRMLSRERGASIVEIVKTTEWKVHSVRAFLTGVRKTGTLNKEERADGTTAYRYTPTSEAPAETDAETEQ